MKTEQLTPEQALAEGAQMPYAYLRSLSGLFLGRTGPSVPPAEELLEARFFNGQCELRLFRDDAGLRAARLSLEEKDETLARKVSLANPRFGSSAEVCRVLDYDEDGQIYCKAALLTGWKEAEE